MTTTTTTTIKEPSRLSAASLLRTSYRNSSFTSLNSDTRSFHTAHTPSPIEMDDREKTMRSNSPLSRSEAPVIPRRSSSQVSRSNSPLNRTKTTPPISRTNSPIPPHLRTPSTPTASGIVTRSPSKRSHTPFPYTVSHKMERSDSGYDDGRSSNGERISPKGRRSPLSGEQKEKVREVEKVGEKVKRRSAGSGSTSRASSRPASSRRSSMRSSPSHSNTGSTTGTKSSSIPIRNASSSTTTSKRPSHTRSTSYQIPSTNQQRPRFNTHNSQSKSYELASRSTTDVQECRLSNLRQRHCFYQFPPLPSSPPSTAHASSSSRKGSIAGISMSGEEYAIPPITHPYHRNSTSTSPNSPEEPSSYQSLEIAEPHHPSPALPVPPQTTLYFLTPETRRLEYAAIDAASRGLRGFVSKLIPDCMMPRPSRRGFHDADEDGSSDGGSVRRYRLPDMGEEVGKERRSRRRSSQESVWEGKERGDGGRKRSGWRRFVPGLRVGRK